VADNTLVGTRFFNRGKYRGIVVIDEEKLQKMAHRASVEAYSREARRLAMSDAEHAEVGKANATSGISAVRRSRE
jgi:hypothetical protein